MKEVLYSVIVPTKNRYEYLIPLIELVESFNNPGMEIVVQDNSDDNTTMEDYMKDKSFVSLKYFYNNSHLSVVQNSDLAIRNSSGKYVTFLGDDDFLSSFAYEYVELMDKYGIESSIFNVALYNWPGLSFVVHKFPNLIIKKYKGIIKRIDVDREYTALLKRGASSLDKMPKVYHGIVRRDVLEKIFNKTGSYFPGPSPDMANSVALSKVVKHHVYCDMPIVSAGSSPKSTAGLGAKHKHTGKLSEMSFLPEGIETRWNDNVPKVWTAPTIYAQSFTEAVVAMDCDCDLDLYNYNYLYAAFCTFCPEFKTDFNNERSNYERFNLLAYSICKHKIFWIRVKHFTNNLLQTKLKKGATLVEDVPNTIEAAKIVDEYLAKDISIKKMFAAYLG